MYTPTMKAAYVPINHVNSSGERLADQLTEADIYEQFNRLNSTKIITHNGKFDLKVLYTTTNWFMPIYWDTFPGAKVLNENEQAGLKWQYINKVDPSIEKYSIEHLFADVEYAQVPPEIFALYAATDSYMTYKLYMYQKSEFEKPENKDLLNLLLNVEIPILPVVAKMELTGISIDFEYAKKVSSIYHKKLDDIQRQIDEELERLKPVIDNWKKTPEANEHYYRISTIDISRPTFEQEAKKKLDAGYIRLEDKKSGRKTVAQFRSPMSDSKSKVEQLSDPIQLSSSTQMAILLYDILNVGVVDKQNPRGTGAEILESLQDKIYICKLLTDKRGVDILLNTFIDKMPEAVSKKTGRLHANFNTYGAATGRFSSSDPNLQNIPSHAKEIRGIFKADEGYSLVGSDFSAQEVRVLASLADDKNMIGAYAAGKDLYATIASLCFKNNYEDNLEFHPVTHVLQPEGKARRSKAKQLLLGLNYGMSTKSLAERIDSSVEDAKKITDEFYSNFDGVKKFTEDSQKMLTSLGYVTDAYGRRRRIPEATLEKYEIIGDKIRFNPLLYTSGKIDDPKIKNYKNLLSKSTYYKEVKSIIDKVESEGYKVINNSAQISRALRQCLNARIQGSSASITKRAMIIVDQDQRLKDLGFQLLVTVHDEIFGQCPRENSEEVGKILSEDMNAAAKEKCGRVVWKTDPYAVSRWYEDELSAEVLKDYNKLISKNISEDNALKELQEKYSMIQLKYLKQMCNGEYECNQHSDI